VFLSHEDILSSEVSRLRGEVHTPTANRGMRAWVLPLNTTTSAMARAPMTMIPLE
jgi:hypothetical protein